MSEMDCARLRRSMLRPGSLASSEAQEHLDDCPACRELARDHAALARALSPGATGGEEISFSFASLDAVLERERRWPSRWKSLPGVTRWLATAAALALPSAFALLRPRTDLGHHPLRMSLEMVALLGLAAVACALWLRPLYRSRPRPRRLAGSLALALGLPWLLASLPPASGPSFPFLAGSVGGQAFLCLALGTGVALPVWLVVRILGRHFGGGSALALLPATAAALAALVGLEIHCPLTDRAHLLGGHAPIAVLLSVAALLARASSDAVNRLTPSGRKRSPNPAATPPPP